MWCHLQLWNTGKTLLCPFEILSKCPHTGWGRQIRVRLNCGNWTQTLLLVQKNPKNFYCMRWTWTIYTWSSALLNMTIATCGSAGSSTLPWSRWHWSWAHASYVIPQHSVYVAVGVGPRHCLCQPHLKFVVPRQRLPVAGDEVEEAVKHPVVSQEEPGDTGILPPMDAAVLHLFITPEGQNIVPNKCSTLPDKERAIRVPHFGAVLCQQPLSHVPPNTPFSQLAVEPILCKMQLDVGAHLLLCGSSPSSVPGWDNIEQVPCIIDGLFWHLTVCCLLLCHAWMHGSLPLNSTKPPQVWWELPVVFIASAPTHARCTSWMSRDYVKRFCLAQIVTIFRFSPSMSAKLLYTPKGFFQSKNVFILSQ